jgi:hypothetical protein
VRFPAISLWQPYASLPLVDAKPWETRSRPFPAKYHGRRVLVASTAAFTPLGFLSTPLHDLCCAVFADDYKETLPRGQALYTIVLKACERTEDMVHKVPPELLASGDFSPGRWAWEWGDAEPLNPFPVKGGQGWYSVDVPEGAFRCQHDPAWETPLFAAAREAKPTLVTATGGDDGPGTNTSKERPAE